MVTKIFKPNSCDDSIGEGSAVYNLPLSWQAHDGTYRMLIQHDLERYPRLLLMDSLGNELEVLVQHLSNKIISIRSNIPITGTVRVI